jgi:hypothetical protein
MNWFQVEKTCKTLKCHKGNQDPNWQERPMDRGEIEAPAEDVDAIEHSGQSQH